MIERYARPRTTALERFSALGEHGAIWLAIGATGAVVDAPRRRRWFEAIGRIGVAYAANQAIKYAVRRERPADRRGEVVGRWSFPSAHATTSFCAARMYSRLGLQLYPLAVALAASRLALRVHHPSDVVAGAALGTVIAR